MMQAQWRAQESEGEALCFSLCKGGYFSDMDEYGLKVVGKTEQRSLSGKNLLALPQLCALTGQQIKDGSTLFVKNGLYYALYPLNLPKGSYVFSYSGVQDLNSGYYFSIFDVSGETIRRFHYFDDSGFSASLPFVISGEAYIGWGYPPTTEEEAISYVARLRDNFQRMSFGKAMIEKFQMTGNNLLDITPIGTINREELDCYFDKTITVSARNNKAKFSVENWILQVQYQDGTASNLSPSTGDLLRTFEATPENPIVLFVTRKSYITTGCYDQVQVKYGTAATDYEPYCGGVPSPNPDYPEEIRCVKAGTKIKAFGKNHFDPAYREVLSETSYGITYTFHADGSITANGTSTGRSVCYIIRGQGDRKAHLKAGVPYTLSGCPAGGDYSTYYMTVQDCTYWQAAQDLGEGATFTSEFTEYYAWITIAEGTSVSNLTFYPMLQEGSEASDYEPYRGSEIIVPCDLYEGDIWYPMSGKVERHNRVLTLDGTSSAFFPYTENGNVCAAALNVSDDPPMNSGGTILVKCNTFKGTSRYHIYENATKGGEFISADPTYIRILSDSLTIPYPGDATPINKYVKDRYDAGKPMTVVYKKQVPSVESYDPQPIRAPQGEVNVIQKNTDVTANMVATMLIRR